MVVQLKEVLDKIIEGNPGLPRISREFKIANAWSKVNHANIAQNSSPEKLVGGVLYINAANSAWAQQINLLKPEIILKLNALIGERIINDIRLKTGFMVNSVAEEKNKRVIICRTCSVEFIGEHDTCPSCSRQSKQERGIRLMKMIEKDPRVRLAEARNILPETTDVDLHRAKRDVMARKADKNMRERRKYGKGKTS